MLGDKSVLSCIDSMLVYSDNDCSLPMGRTVGWSKIDGFLHDQGFKNTYINNYDYSGNNYNLDKLSTAKDEVDLAYRLNAGTLLNKENTEIMLSRMKRQVWRERIPAGLPAEIIVADKPGWLENIQNDTAIVYGARSTYIISIMSIGSTVTKLADLSRVVYETLN